MVAHNSRGNPDPSQQLRASTVEQLRAALGSQRSAGTEPLPELRGAIRTAAAEARERGIHADALLAQLNQMLQDASRESTSLGPIENRGIKEWLITACLKAYWYESA
jgi:hypothetical protein